MKKDIKKVFIVEPSGNLWGSERALLDLCEGLKKSHWKFAMCCPPKTPIIEKAESLCEYIYPTFIPNLHKKGKLQRIVAVFNLCKAIIKYKPDLIYVNQAGAIKVALIAAYFCNLNVIVHTRLIEDVEYLKSIRFNKKIVRNICISDYILNAFKLGKPTSIVSTKLYDSYNPTQMDLNVTILKKNTIICLGRITHIKGQDILVEGFSKFCEEEPDVTLNIVGETDQEDQYVLEIKENIARLHIENRVKFIKFSKDVWPYLHEATFLICPSRIEPLGRIIFEAWDAGIIPIAASNSGGPAETIKASGGGLLYDENIPKSIADILSVAFKLPLSEQKSIVEKGRKWMLKELNPIKYANNVATLFDHSN